MGRLAPSRISSTSSRPHCAYRPKKRDVTRNFSLFCKLRPIFRDDVCTYADEYLNAGNQGRFLEVVEKLTDKYEYFR